MSRTRSAWEREAGGWIEWARSPGLDHTFWGFNLPALLDLAPPPGRLTVDVGCGEGRVARELIRRGHTVVGVEGSEALAAAARATEPAFAEERERDGRDMTFHDIHRPLSAYAAALEQAGLPIESLREPVPGEAYLAEHPEMERWTRKPCFLHVRAVKP